LLSQDVSVGPQGSWGAPRDEGFEYNWAQAGATSDTLLADGQHAGLAQQITAGSIDYGVLAIGQNDFGPWTEAYVEIYNGTWDAAQIDAYVGQVVGNIQTALQTLTATGGKIVLSNVIDYGIAPRTRSLWPDPDKRELVTDVIRRVNGALLGLAQEYAVPLINGFAATKNFLGDNQTTVATIPVGGVDLVNANGVEPQCMFVDDGIHPHTVGQAVIANLVVEAIRLGYGQDVAALPFTEREMLELVGLGNQYTGDTLNLNYTQYIILPGNPPGISVSPISRPTAEPNGTATFTIVLNTQPVADVTIHLNSSNPNEGTVSPTSVTFTVANWNVPQVVTVTGVDDDKDDGTVAYSVVTAPAVSYRRSLPGTGCRRRGGVESR
jgi:lysophospholipase L1-like esterase